MSGTASEPSTFGGRRIVVLLYVILVAVGTVAGVLVGVFVENLSRPELFGVISLPATPLGFALFGGITMAAVLGVPLALVVAVSREIDDPHAVDDEE